MSFTCAAEIKMFDNHTIVYKFVQDLHFFMTRTDDENELMLAVVLQGFFDSVSLLLRNTVDKREALENLDLILLCLDEIVDRGYAFTLVFPDISLFCCVLFGGMILETDANVIAGKVAVNSMDPSAPLSEQTISQALSKLASGGRVCRCWQTRATSGEEVPRMPAVILDRKPTRRGNTSIIKLLIHWIGSSHADASCEWLDMVMDHFPEFVG
ncbi:Coatomer subunit zeta-2 [Turnera subulata]|uniref:Coatomer subunit zeta n=1 Tax=Turnera subulata TaxID=218843 RepID=A0A9Q0JE05_9ROSI|nr:Coatomer subunit zeta-2 [Turnera subulata]